MLYAMKNAEITLRAKAFAVRIFKLAEALPRNFTGKTIAAQIARSGSSVAANLRAADCTRRKSEFLAKMQIAYEEADETLFWLEMCVEAECISERKVGGLMREANEIVSVIVSIIKTTRGRIRSGE